MSHPAAPHGVLDEQPVLRRPATARALHELVSHERARQDARLGALRRLRGDAEALFRAPTDDDARGGVLGRLGSVFRRRRAPTEMELRARYEDAELRARKATVFAESLASLEGELADELRRLGDVLVDLAHDVGAIDAVRDRVRHAATDYEAARTSATDAVRQRELDGLLERARRRADVLESQRAAVHEAEDRLLGLVEAERMLTARLAHLRGEVERAAREATAQLDAVAASLRMLVTSADTERVLVDLERSLTVLFGSLDESARLARAAAAVADEDDAADRRKPR